MPPHNGLYAHSEAFYTFFYLSPLFFKNKILYVAILVFRLVNLFFLAVVGLDFADKTGNGQNLCGVCIHEDVVCAH